MAISFAKLKALLDERKISIYKLKSDKIIGTATIDKIRSGMLMGKSLKNGVKRQNVDTASIDSICKYLHCQPGDIMEYVPDDSEQV